MKTNQIMFKDKTKNNKIINFRYPTIDDAEILKNYINKISLEKTYISYQGEQQTLEEEKQWLESIIKGINENKCVHILAFIDKKLVGGSDISLGKYFAKHVGNFGITIDIDYRGLGIGKKIMEITINEAVKKLNGLKIIKLGVFSNNTIAQNLYKKMGFVEFGRLPHGAKHRNDYVDEILMYKKIK